MSRDSRRNVPAIGTLLLGAALLAAVPPPSYGDPPPWAPAHGWRKKHDPYYMGYTGKKWKSDYGVYSGRCDRAAVAGVIGATVGGVIGSQVGKGDGRAVATVLGAVLGAVIGSQVGRDMDQADRACTGHALELARDRRSVTWINPQTGVNYRVTPLGAVDVSGRRCRQFSTRVGYMGQQEFMRGTACRGEDGMWQVVS
ncbi:MAG: glycine zipper 2TM domain-containing protein [Betaproteobacteria bacterium]|nr:glycine zipper 2TM domain-containing protein [Betaproteobacteria bacterium]